MNSFFLTESQLHWPLQKLRQFHPASSSTYPQPKRPWRDHECDWIASWWVTPNQRSSGTRTTSLLRSPRTSSCCLKVTAAHCVSGRPIWRIPEPTESLPTISTAKLKVSVNCMLNVSDFNISRVSIIFTLREKTKYFCIRIWGNLCIFAALSELSDASIGEMTSPRFSQPLRDFSVQSGHRVCLQCRITGHPIPEAKWYKDNKPIDNSPDYEVRLSLYLQ